MFFVNPFEVKNKCLLFIIISFIPTNRNLMTCKLSNFQCFQIDFLLCCYSITLHTFLNRFIMCPIIKLLFFQIRKYGSILFRQCRSKIPCNHHIDVILFRFYCCHHVCILGIKPLVQEMLHQHADSKPHGINLIRPNPFLNIR